MKTFPDLPGARASLGAAGDTWPPAPQLPSALRATAAGRPCDGVPPSKANAWLKPLELVVGDGQWLSLFRPHVLDFPGFRDLIFGEKMGEVQNSLALLECLSSLSMRAPWRVKKTSESTMFCLTSRSLKLC